MFGPKDPFPNFMPQWTHAVVFIHKHCKKEIKEKMRGHSSLDLKNIVIDLVRKKFNLSYTIGGMCLIGEAHRFNGNYDSGEAYCRECRNFCFSPAADACRSIGELYDFKREVMEHFKEAHPELSKIGQCRG